MEHESPTLFLVWCPEQSEGEDDGRRFKASSPLDAAKKWAEWDDAYSAEYRIVSGLDAPTVFVRRADRPTDEPFRFRVFGESLPCYTARLQP